ncbi:MAG: TonB family protein [Muribaculaceae bacterium]|nr:TonB family protein [Muribaculaceae bacterium]
MMKKLYFLLVACALMLPFAGIAQNNTDKGDTQQLVLTPEQQPQFPGGLVELSRFIQANMQYPATAQQNGIQGKVVLQFIVTTTGEVRDVEVLRSVDPVLDAEAVRICQMLPRFTPGTLGGKPVNVKYALPINFTLNQEVPDITNECLTRANAGDRDAQYNVGCCYYKGLGVPVDWIVARYYLGLAAAQGHTEAAQLLEKAKQNLRGELDPPITH